MTYKKFTEQYLLNENGEKFYQKVDVKMTKWTKTQGYRCFNVLIWQTSLVQNLKNSYF
jgi:hypothetical protein